MSKIKNFLLTAAAVLATQSLMAAPLTVSRTAPTVSEDFNSMWDGEAATLTLPEGWLIDRNLDAPRSVNPWSSATATVMYSGGVSLASNASNGTWNFGSSADPSDRAIGGLTTTVANGTRCISLMTSIQNEDADAIKALNISYNIEKYRKGDNSAGFTVQLYFSADGHTWTNAGDDFKTYFEPDNETNGVAVVPISSTPVAKTLLADVAAGNTIYLAWNISVASGTSPNKAPGLAIDDVKVTAEFADADVHTLYIENATGKSGLKIYSTTTDYFGAAPGSAASLTKIVNGVTYSVWEMPKVQSFNLYASVGNYSFGPVEVNATADAYYCVAPDGISGIADPENYSGWVDPSRKPFVASGYYLRGEVNSWGAPDDWEFSNEGDGVYVLYDKTLSGAFKVADANWSSNFDYGSNGTNIELGTPYLLTAGTGDNITCGNYEYVCKRIVLTLSDDGAYLLLEGDDSEDGLSSVYMVGDFNGWDFGSKAGELKLDEATGLFKGRVSMKAGSNGLSQWRLYQRLGKSGAWGLVEDATGAALNGTLVKGETANAAVAPATYDVTFSLTDGAYSFTKVESTPSVMTLSPANVVLTPENPEKIKVLSLNNSLIHYNDQDFVFNDIAKAMNVDAAWTKHTNLGKPLSYHWEEGDGLAADGTPGAKMMVRSDAWSHIILQEQSSLPRTNPETFRANVEQWIGYIRQYCPNPNAVILLPVNWAYSGDWGNFNGYNARFLEVYADVAAEFGAVVVPVAMAYDNMYTAEGKEVVGEMFSDDRHPTPKATYMAACMEYAAIFGVDPLDITHTPSGLTESEGETMRSYASAAYKAYNNTVSHLTKTVNFRTALFDDFGMEYPIEGVEFSVDGGGSIGNDGVFVSDGNRGTFTVTAKYGDFEKSATVTVADHETEVETFPAIVLNAENLSAGQNFDSIGSEAGTTLPETWRIDRQTVAPRTLGTYATAQTQTAYSGGEKLPSNAKNGLWNFGATDGSDRAIGGISTGVADGTRCVNVYTHLQNDGKKRLEKVTVSYDIEKYRKGNNAEGFAVLLYYSYDGRVWTSAGEEFYTFFKADAATEGYDVVPGETVGVEAQLPVDLMPGLDLYLAWNISVAKGDAAQGAMALAIDNFAVSASLPEVLVYDHYVYADNQTSWAALGLYAWGDGEVFGAWPGQAPIDEKEIEGTTYQVFGFNGTGDYNLIFNNWNNNKQLADYAIDSSKDRYFRIDDDGVTELSAPSSVVDNVAVTQSLTFSGDSIRQSGNAELRVYNVSGRLLLSSCEEEVNVSHFPAGVYVATDSVNTLKFIKK